MGGLGSKLLATVADPTRRHAYVWGNEQTLDDTKLTRIFDLVSLPRFEVPRPLRVSLVGPFPGSAVNVEFRAIVGRGDTRTEERVLLWNRSTGRGEHVLYGSSLRVNARYVSGAPIPAGVTVAAWATPADDAGLVASRPKPFGIIPTSASHAQAVVGAQLVAAGERRRVTIANRPAAATDLLLLAYGRVATAADFDYIVPANSTFVEEAWEGTIFGIWSAAGAGFARTSVFVD